MSFGGLVFIFNISPMFASSWIINLDAFRRVISSDLWLWWSYCGVHLGQGGVHLSGGMQGPIFPMASDAEA